MAGVSDHYETLGVDPTATLPEIRSAYHKLALKHHPDRNGGSKESEEIFRSISRAYSVLSDDRQRLIYDRERARPAPRPVYGGAYTAPAPQGHEGWTQGPKYEAVKNSYFYKASARRKARNEQRSQPHVFESLSSFEDLPGQGLEAPFDLTKPFKVVSNAPQLGVPVKIIDIFASLPGFEIFRKKE